MGKGAGKKKQAAADPAAVEIDIIGGDKTRCGPVQNTVWSLLVFIFFAAAICCWIAPQSTWKKITCDDLPNDDCAEVLGGAARKAPGRINTYPGVHYDFLKDSFGLQSDSKPEPEQTSVTFFWVMQMFSNLCALPYFIVFTCFPGWAYKIHFRGGGSCKIPFIKCSLPLTCGKIAAANEEQTHQADQMSRMLGLFIGLTFGIINFFNRMGVKTLYDDPRQSEKSVHAPDASLQMAGDTALCHMAVWFMLMVFHASSLFNKGSPRCYAIYQLCFCGALAFVFLLCSGAVNEDFDFDIQEEVAGDI